MAYRHADVGSYEIIDKSCAFVIPPINDNARLMEATQCAVAAFKSSAPIRMLSPVFLHYTDTGWVVSTNPEGSKGFVGIVVDNGPDGPSVQLVGNSFFKATTDSLHIGKYILNDGTLYNPGSDIKRVVGKIVRVVDQKTYEILLHSLPEASNRKIVGGYPSSAVTREVTSEETYYSSDVMYLKWNGSDTGNDFTVGPESSVTPELNDVGTSVLEILELTLPKTFASGSVSVHTRNHTGVPKDPTPADTLHLSVSLTGNLVKVFAPSGKSFNSYGAFDVIITIQGFIL